MLQKFKLIFFICFITFVKPLLSNDLFKYNNFFVYNSNEIKTDIKKDALLAFELQALESVLSKITTLQYANKIKSILNELDVAKFITSYSINNEDISKNKYSANITFVLNDKEVIALLEKNKIPYTLGVFNTSYLIIPIFSVNNQKIDNVDWDNLWIQNTETFFLSSFVYYNYNNFINNKNLNFIKDTQKSLNINDIYIAEVVLNKDFNNYNLIITNLITKQKTEATEINSLIEAKFIVASIIEDSAKKLAILKQENNSYINLSLVVNYSSLSSFIDVENILKNDQNASNIVVKEFGYNYAIINFNYKENLNKLGFFLQERCFFFNTDTLNISVIPNCN